jgi:hypothetical protein
MREEAIILAPGTRFVRTGLSVKTMRFDHHEEPVREQDRSILYGASRIPICIAEFLQVGP